MKCRSIGFLPLLMTIMMALLFALKFYGETKRAGYAAQLSVLINEAGYDGTVVWSQRRSNYFEALKVLVAARESKLDLDDLLDHTMEEIGADRAYGAVLAAGLLRNLDIADQMELLTEENFKRLEAGEKLKIGGGGFKGEVVVLGNLVPYRYSPELEMSYANLLLKPERVARRYPDEIGEGALTLMSACRSAEIMTETSYERAVRAVRSGRS